MDEDKCQKCGTPASPGAKYCESCGALLPGAEPQPPLTAPSEPQPEAQQGTQPERGGAPAYVPPPAYQAPPYAAPATGMHYQGVAIRFVAILIDVIILAIITGIVTAPFNIPSSISVTNTTGIPMVSTTPNPLAWVGGLISALIDLVYFVWLQGAYGQTVGKMAVKIKVVREDGSKIDYADAVVRTILALIDLIPYFIPYLLGAILIWSSDKKQRLGDRAAHTVVVKV
ncbi:MAG: RDD family protein [Halobacteriota archaeon]